MAIEQSTHPRSSFFMSFWSKTILLLLLWGVTFFPVYPELWHTWMYDSNNSHGMLVPLITIFLIWTKRDQLANVHIRYSNWGSLVLIVSLALYLLALAGQMAVVQRGMIVVSLIGLILFNFGSNVFRILAFPLLFLIFMIPIPVSIYNLLAFPLQLFATDVSHALIQALSIPVLQEGNMLYFAQTQLEVAEACSGLRSMMAFVMLAALFAYLLRSNIWLRGIMLFSAIPLAVISNIVRVTGTGILAHFYGKQVAQGFLHEFSGIVVFVFGFLLMSCEYILLSKIKKNSL